MAKKDDTHPILQEIKNTAKEHQAFEKERGKGLIYGHALDIASKKLVNVDWNTACAMAKKGTLSTHDEAIETEPMYSIHFPDVREGVLFPHQIKDMSRQMELGTFDGKGKTLIIPEFVTSPPKEVAEATRETLRALVESGEMIDTTGMSEDEGIEAFKKMAEKLQENRSSDLFILNDAHAYFDQPSAKIEDAMRYVRDGRETHILSGTQSLSDFTPSSKKVFYSKRNHLMGEWEDLLRDPHYEEIPYEIDSFEEMGLWAKNHGGTLFFPTTSVADLRNLSEVEKEAIESNVITKFFTTDEAVHSIIVGPSGASHSIIELLQQVREENPSLDEEDAMKIVRDRCRPQSAPDSGMSFFLKSLVRQELKRNPSSVVTVMDGGKSMTNNNGGAPIQKSKSFVRSSQDNHAKAKFSARGH